MVLLFLIFLTSILVQASPYFVGVHGGVSDYSGTKQVQGVYQTGVGIGAWLNDQLSLELAYQRSFYNVLEGRCLVAGCTEYDIPVDLRLEQTSMSFSGNYYFLNENVRPFVGATIGFTRNHYFGKTSLALQDAGEIRSVRRPSSTSLHTGPTVGALVSITEQFSLGGAWKYLFNFLHRYDDEPARDSFSGSLYGEDKSIENLSFYVLSLNAHYRF